MKKGQANVLTTVLLVAMAIVGVLLVFNIVKPLVTEKGEDINADYKNLVLSRLEVEEWTDHGDTLDVTIHRGAGEEDFNGFKVGLETDLGVCYIEFVGSLEELETKSYTVSKGECGTIIDIISVQGVDTNSIYINSCQDLDKSGYIYYLTQDLVGEEVANTCMRIGTNNVILDCQGHSITRTQDPPLIGSLYGVYSDRLNTQVKNCDINMGRKGFGIYLKNSDNSIIFKNTLSGQEIGIFSGSSDYVEIRENTVINNLQDGIRLASGSQHNEVIDNIANDNGAKGIQLVDSDYNLVESNEFRRNRNNGGIQLNRADYNTIKDNLIDASYNYGIWVWDSANNIFENNYIKNCQDAYYGPNGLTGGRGIFIRNSAAKNNKIYCEKFENNYVDVVDWGDNTIYYGPAGPTGLSESKRQDYDCSNYCIWEGDKCGEASQIPQDYVSWWKFENTVDDEKLINNGINNGITYAAGKSGQAAVFDGSSYVSISSSDSITNAIADGKISVSYWIKQDTLSNYQAHFNFFKDVNNRQYLMNYQGKLRAWQSPGSTGNIGITSSIYLDNNWKHVVWVIDGTSNKIYVDGLYKETLTLTSPLSTLGTGVGAFMGYSGNPTTYEYYLDGAMDEVIIYDRVLTPTEIGIIYHEQDGGVVEPLQCQLTNAYWQPTTATEGDSVQLIVEGNDCDGEEISFEVYEDDGAFGQDYVTAILGIYDGTNWVTQYVSDQWGGPEYYFTATLVSDVSKTISSKSLTNGMLEVSELQIIPDCLIGSQIISTCICNGIEYSNGYCCNGGWSASGCSVAQIPQDYVAYWKFEGNALDEKGTSNGNEINYPAEVTYESGISGQALSLDGSNNIKVSASSVITNAIADGKSSVSMWVRYSNHGTNQALFTFYRDVNNRQYIRKETGPSRIYQIIGGISDSALTSETYFDTDWHHLVWQIDGQSNKIYIDGIYKETLNLDNPISNLGGNVGVMMGNSGSVQYPYYFYGLIDEVIMYDRILSDQEILNIYSNQGGVMCPNCDSGEFCNVNTGVCEQEKINELITRDEIMETAHLYWDVEWRADSDNYRDFHTNINGPGQINFIPYTWYGHDEIYEFFKKMDYGLEAGEDNHTSEYFSGLVGGVECSGYVAECWKEPAKLFTNEFPPISFLIDKVDLAPGDVMVDSGSHTRLIEEWPYEYNSGQAKIYEAAGSTTGKVRRIGTSDFSDYVYRRYNYVSSKPSIISVRQEGANSVKIKWLGDLGTVATASNSYFKIYKSLNGVDWSLNTTKTGLQLTDQTAIIKGLVQNTQYYFKVTAVKSGVESGSSDVYSVRLDSDGRPDVLIVDGFDSWFTDFENPGRLNNDFSTSYANALNEVGVSFETVDNLIITRSRTTGRTIDEGDYFDLTQYPVIFYMLGKEGDGGKRDYALTFLEEGALKRYITSGGKLFISGSNIGYDLVENDPHLTNIPLTDSYFYNAYLKAGYVSNDANTYSVNAGTGIFSGVNSFSIDNGAMNYNVDAPDKIITSGGSSTILTYNGGLGGTAGVAYGNNLVYLAFPYESITSETVRNQMMSKIKTYLGL